MFTADEIRDIRFSKSGIGGYKAADVDDFRYRIADDFEALENSNSELVEKIKILAEHIERLQENEESVKTCIINAQVTADRVMRQADMKSKELLLESEEKADLLISEAQKKAEYIFNETKVKSEEFLLAAQDKANAIVADAESKAIALRNETDKKIDLQKKVYERLKNEILTFRDASIETCVKQLELLKSVSDSELLLDTVADTDTTDEDFSEKFANDLIEPTAKEIEEEPEENITNETVEIDEIEDQEELQGSLFEYKQ